MSFSLKTEFTHTSCNVESQTFLLRAFLSQHLFRVLPRQPASDVTLQRDHRDGELPLLLLKSHLGEPTANARLHHDDPPQLFLVKLREKFDVVVLEEDFGLA